MRIEIALGAGDRIQQLRRQPVALRGIVPARLGGLAEDYEGDDSLALPVPGAGWGPAPPEGTTTTGTVRPAPKPVPTSGEGAAAMGPANPVVALDRGNRLGVAPDEPAAAPVTPPGWYADPEDPTRQRFWDGTAWTEHRG